MDNAGASLTRIVDCLRLGGLSSETNAEPVSAISSGVIEITGSCIILSIAPPVVATGDAVALADMSASSGDPCAVSGQAGGARAPTGRASGRSGHPGVRGQVSPLSVNG